MFPWNIICARKNIAEKLQCQELSIGSVLFWRCAGGEDFIWWGMPKCAAKGTVRATEASTSKGATIELERAMTLRHKESDAWDPRGWCKKWLRLKHRELQNGFGIWTPKDFDGFVPNPPALSSFSHQKMAIPGGAHLQTSPNKVGCISL